MRRLSRNNWCKKLFEVCTPRNTARLAVANCREVAEDSDVGTLCSHSFLRLPKDVRKFRLHRGDGARRGQGTTGRVKRQDLVRREPAAVAGGGGNRLANQGLGSGHGSR